MWVCDYMYSTIPTEKIRQWRQWFTNIATYLYLLPIDICYCLNNNVINVIILLLMNLCVYCNGCHSSKMDLSIHIHNCRHLYFTVFRNWGYFKDQTQKKIYLWKSGFQSVDKHQHIYNITLSKDTGKGKCKNFMNLTKKLCLNLVY